MCPSLRRTFAWFFVVACVGCAAPAPEKPAEPQNTVAAPKPTPAPSPALAPRTAPAPVATPATAEHELGRGIHSYEDGEYKRASRELQAALDLGLEAKRDRAKAHKYLAFIVCATGREKSCRDQFRMALEADPAFELEPAEVGNPIWRAALRAAKAERAKSKSQ
jgi:hypothetical protein